FAAMEASEERKETCAGDLIGSVQGEVRRGSYRRFMPSTFWFMCLAFINEVTGTIAIRGALKNDRKFIRSRWIERTQNPNTSCNMIVQGWLQHAKLELLRRPIQTVRCLGPVRSGANTHSVSRQICFRNSSLFQELVV
ncbi:MAG: hypothetical protein ACPHJ3_00560, partial [Rubripirellula sp.]